MCLDDMTSYAPPYALRVMTVSLGTVASAKAYSSLAPCLMMPPNSCAVPGRKPGTSTNVRSGMLKQSQKRTKRAALTEAAMSRQRAHVVGLGRIEGDERVELGVLAVGPVARGPARRIFPVVLRQVGQQVADRLEARRLV